MDESDLIRKAASGDEAAFGSLVTEHAAAILAVARARTRDAALAEEIAQDTFVRLFRHLSTFRGDSSLRTWLVRITLNLCTDAQRRDPRRFEDAMNSTQHPASPEDDVEQQRIREQDALMVRGAIARLPEPLRLVVNLRYEAGLSYAEIGSLLGVPIGTVGSRLASALQQLRMELAR